ncbi:MAG: efflux RND transporter periplasmic adaptor subunit [Thermovirgaceae bacterium]|jgi:membrane fusion protein (multidrug efflux system)|nr:efflux RND transporter periplasmic adaptor subunit [Synergistales bacterium]MDI9391778.1 efflux RND transporter periplasmic adaptor subunit [Synergistota bacterium]MDY0178244.1 efflux RND transporter periplasmic adaptor subunit [Synergistaceae bacterium]HRW86817.1 efflux RND transporter periplasmic adaptor subunit [Thermovirgaceae bacterium]MDD3133002.1 efflux RND transporter periplasmic adaptor subunit [Synergistales bacterium]
MNSMKKGKTSYRWIWWLLLILLVAFGAWRIFFRPVPQPPVSVAEIRSREGIPVTVHEVASSHWEHWINFFGRAQASSEVTIAAERQEYVSSVNVDVGDQVRNGQVLATLDVRVTRERLAAQEASVAEKQGRYRRLSALRSAGGASVQEVEAALSDAKSAQASLKDIQMSLSRMTITSPLDGIVTGRSVETGNLVSPGQTLFSVADLEAIEVVLDVSPKDIFKIVRGMPARVRTPNGWIKAGIKRVDPVADSSTGLFSVILSVPPGSGLSPGQALEAQVQDEDIADAIVVPYEALKQIGGERTVVYVETDGVAEERDVITGGSYEGSVRILSGVEPGQKVVVKGSDRMFPNARIWVQEDQ